MPEECRAEHVWRATLRSSTTLLAACGLLVAITLPAPAATTPHEALREQLADEQRDLEDLRAHLAALDAEVAALDVELGTTGAQLAELAEQRATADRALTDARTHEQQARDDLLAVDRDVDDQLARWRTNRDVLADQVVHRFKHGGTPAEELLVGGVVQAGDWHEVSVTMTAVERLISDGRDAIGEAAEETRALAAGRQQADEARRVVADHRRQADDVLAELERLTAAEERQRSHLEEARAGRAALLATIERDLSLQAVLVTDLEERLARLELTASRVLVPVEVDLDPFGAPPPWADRLPGDGRRWGAAIEAVAGRAGIDARLLAAVVWTESGFQPTAVSPAGALGLAQLMPATARGLGVDPADPLENLAGGADYLRAQLDRFDRVDLALAAYNAGPGRVERAGNRLPMIAETQLYVPRVLDRYEQLLGD